MYRLEPPFRRENTLYIIKRANISVPITVSSTGGKSTNILLLWTDNFHTPVHNIT